MKRFLSTLVAVLAIVIGAALTGLGALGIAVFGVAGTTTGASTTLESAETSLAIVADLERVDVGIPFAELVGTPSLTVTGATGGSVFVGTAAQAAVDKYLFGVPYDLASNSGTWTLSPVPGIETTVGEPSSEDFWIEEALGVSADIPLQTGSDPTTLVIMNADATPGVAVDLVLGFQGPYIFYYSIGAIVVGLILIVVAIALVASGRRRRGQQRPADLVDISDDAAVSSFFGDSGALTSDDRSD